MNKQNFKNGNAMFPISTDALEFMQEQNFLVARLAELAGPYVIISQPANGKAGLCVFDGELLPLSGDAAATHIGVTEIKTDIIAHGTTYRDARVTREAVYGTSGAPASSFVVLDNMSALKSAIADLTTALNTEGTTRAQHDVPKGTIIDWYGTCKCDLIPYGWIPCGLFFKGQAKSFSPGNTGWIEIDKWKKKYSNITIESATRDGSNFGIYISYCMGQSIPDLTDRFIVQAGFGYNLGETGGQNKVTLNASECALPEHRHTVLRAKSDGREIGDYCFGSPAHDKGLRAEYCDTLSDSTPQYEAIGSTEIDRATDSHENRPPFFALYKLIKVI